MRSFVLLTTAGCHLCAHGREVLDTLASDGLLSWREVDAGSPEGQRLVGSAPPLRPVLFDADGAVIAYGRLSRRRLVRQLHGGAAAPELAADASGNRN